MTNDKNIEEVSEPDFVDMVADRDIKEHITSLEVIINQGLRMAITRMKQGDVKRARTYTNRVSKKMTELLKLVD